MYITRLVRKVFLLIITIYNFTLQSIYRLLHNTLSTMELLGYRIMAILGSISSTIPSFVAVVSALAIFILRKETIFEALSSFSKPSKSETPVEAADETGTISKLQDLKSIKDKHDAAKVLAELIEKDGAGAWPPKANHTSWPRALQPYKDIYLELNSMLPSANPSLDDGVNEERRNNYRSRMRKLFAERVDISQVESLLAATEAGDWDVLTRDAYNGFYCAVAVCRHAYR